MTENTTPLEMTEQDKLDLASINVGYEGEDTPAPTKRTLLELWNEIFSSLEANEAEKIDPATASRVVSVWPQLKIQEVARYHEIYYARLRELRTILHILIEAHPKALENTEDDAEKNGDLYTELLIDWQVCLQEWQQEWTCTDAEAHIILAAEADALNFTVGAHGLANHLSEIGFDFSDERQARIVEALEDAKAGL